MRTFIMIALPLGLAACATPPSKESTPAMTEPSQMVTLTGTAIYMQRIALPPEAKLTVRVSDVSLADAPAPVIAETIVETAGRQVPLAFSLSYDAAKIDPRHRYAVSARIEDGSGKLIWITDTHNPLPPAGQTIELRLVQVRG